jgi:hypothetical protein
LLPIHHTQDLVVRNAPADTDLRIKDTSDLVHLEGGEAVESCCPAREQGTKAGRKGFCSQVIGCHDTSRLESIFEGRAEEGSGSEVFGPEVRENHAISPATSKPLTVAAEQGAFLEQVHRPEHIFAHLPDRIPHHDLSVRMAEPDALFADGRNRSESSVLDFQYDQPKIRSHDDEIGMSSLD